MIPYLLVKPFNDSQKYVKELEKKVYALPGLGKFRKDDNDIYEFSDEGYLYLEAMDYTFIAYSLIHLKYVDEVKEPELSEYMNQTPKIDFNPLLPFYILSYDLGQASDYTAAVIIECIKRNYIVKDIRRYPLDMPYPDIVDRIKAAHENKNISPNMIVIDKTGVGRPVWDMLKKKRLPFFGINITGGQKPNKKGRDFNVPKRDLVSTAQILWQQNRLQIEQGIPSASLLLEELQNFEVKISKSGHDQYGAWRAGTNDDIVLALVIGLWSAEVGLLPNNLKKQSGKLMSRKNRINRAKTRRDSGIKGRGLL